MTTDTTEHIRQSIAAEGGYADIETINGYLLLTLRAGEHGTGLAIRVAFDPYTSGELIHFLNAARRTAIQDRAAQYAPPADPELAIPDETLPPPLDGLEGSPAA